MQQLLNDKWLEIDIDAIVNNLEIVQSLLNDGVRLIAVVKADAYGQGAVEITRTLAEKGVDYFGVSFLEEALELRKAGIFNNILVFSPIINEDQIVAAVFHNITLTVASLYDSQLIDKVSRKLKHLITVHLKVDTGLGRFGINKEEIIQISSSLKENSNIYIEGIYTHMAEAASKNPYYTRKQYARFMEMVQKVLDTGISIPLRHCANSAVLLKYPDMQLDAVRVGTLLSGQHPAGKFPIQLPILDPFKLKTRIIAIKILEAGSCLGYYRTFKLNKKAQIAVIPVGFNDGLALSVANKPTGLFDLLKIILKRILNYLDFPRFSLHVIFKGECFPIRGKVFMQMALIELPMELEVKIGDEIEVLVSKTLVRKTITRVYVKDKKIYWDKNRHQVENIKDAETPENYEL